MRSVRVPSAHTWQVPESMMSHISPSSGLGRVSNKRGREGRAGRACRVQKDFLSGSMRVAVSEAEAFASTVRLPFNARTRAPSMRRPALDEPYVLLVFKAFFKAFGPELDEGLLV